MDAMSSISNSFSGSPVGWREMQFVAQCLTPGHTWYVNHAECVP